MLLSILEKFGLEAPLATTMQLLMANRSIKRMVVILHAVLLKLDKFIISSNFVILDYEVDELCLS